MRDYRDMNYWEASSGSPETSEHSKLEQTLMTVILTVGIIVASVIETAAMYAGAALVLIGIAVIIYSLARHGTHPAMEPVRVRVIPEETERPNLRKAA